MDTDRNGLRIIHSPDDLLSPEYLELRKQINEENQNHRKRMDALLRQSFELSLRERCGHGQE